MKRREFITLIGAAVAWPLAARAQQAEKKRTIGLLAPSSPTPAVTAFDASFIDALRELGWIEGKDITFERRYAENRLERLPELAAELASACDPHDSQRPASTSTTSPPVQRPAFMRLCPLTRSACCSFTGHTRQTVLFGAPL